MSFRPEKRKALREFSKLSPDEIRAFWSASSKLPYPVSQIYQLLLLTACRLKEVGAADWEEFDFSNRVWTIAARRMKAKAAHCVPLTDDIMVLLRELPGFEAKAGYLFVTGDGSHPFGAYSKAKRALDKAMKAELEAEGLRFTKFVNHDIRRTCRTRFSAIRMDSEVRELLQQAANPPIGGATQVSCAVADFPAALRLARGQHRRMARGATGCHPQSAEASCRLRDWRNVSGVTQRPFSPHGGRFRGPLVFLLRLRLHRLLNQSANHLGARGKSLLAAAQIIKRFQQAILDQKGEARLRLTLFLFSAHVVQL